MAEQWMPVEDGDYVRPNWDGKGEVTLKISYSGSELEEWHSSNPGDIEEIGLPAEYRVCRLVAAPDAPQVEALEYPDGPGWWAFEGSEWESKALYLVDGRETPWQESWNEAAEEHWYRYELNLYDVHRYVDVKGKPFQSVLEVRWIRKGEAISNREHCGPHEGEPVLGFVSPNYRWSSALYGIDTLVGKWWRVHLPWEQPAPAAHADE